MAKIAFVTDSTTYLPKELLGNTQLDVVPTIVIWSGEELRDGVDIQPSEFYQRLSSDPEIPTTSQPTPASFKDVYEKHVANGIKDIISVHVSVKLSGTVTSAKQAADMVPDANVTIIDARSASMGTGWPLLEGIKAANAGKSPAEVEKAIRTAIDHTGLLLMVDTLEFLHKGGRIGAVSRYLGTALNLKPILEVQEGALLPLERVRTKKKAMSRLIELVDERAAGRKPLMVAVLHADAETAAHELLEDVKTYFDLDEVAFTDVSPSVGTHTGPGTLGLSYIAGM